MKGTVKITISKPSFVYGQQAGRMLRLVVDMIYYPSGYSEDAQDALGVSVDGCLVGRKKDGKLFFSFPMVRWGKRETKNVTGTSAFHDLVLKAITERGYADYIGVEVLAQNEHKTLAGDVEKVDKNLSTESFEIMEALG